MTRLSFKQSSLFKKVKNTIPYSYRSHIHKILRYRLLNNSDTTYLVFDGEKHVKLVDYEDSDSYSFFERNNPAKKYDIWILKELCKSFEQKKSSNLELKSKLSKLKRAVSRYVHLNCSFDLYQYDLESVILMLDIEQKRISEKIKRKKQFLLDTLPSQSFGPIKVTKIDCPEILKKISKGTSWCTTRLETAKKYIAENNSLFYIHTVPEFKEVLLAPSKVEIKCADNKDLPGESLEAVIKNNWPAYRFYSAKWKRTHDVEYQDPSDPALIQASMEIFGLTEQTDRFWSAEKLAALF